MPQWRPLLGPNKTGVPHFSPPDSVTYLLQRYSQYKRRLHEDQVKKTTEKELQKIKSKIDDLLSHLDVPGPGQMRVKHDSSQKQQDLKHGEECAICLTGTPTMKTMPCGHEAVCRRCFIKTMQQAIKQRSIPLRCVLCRAPIYKLIRRKEPFESDQENEVTEFSSIDDFFMPSKDLKKDKVSTPTKSQPKSPIITHNAVMNQTTGRTKDIPSSARIVSKRLLTPVPARVQIKRSDQQARYSKSSRY
ncbi:unnamed protein product [Owenia fusiformis]|nr:unnamed protein product [Owenia fusiformis]